MPLTNRRWMPVVVLTLLVVTEQSGLAQSPAPAAIDRSTTANPPAPPQLGFFGGAPQPTFDANARREAARKAYLQGASDYDVGLFPEKPQVPWQAYQNPLAPENRYDVGADRANANAPNTYYGPRERTWSNMRLGTEQSFGMSRYGVNPGPSPAAAHYSTDRWNGGSWKAWENQQSANPGRAAFGSWNLRP
jgi:hypothetical protein